MSDINELHEEAMELTDEALLAKRRGQHDQAKKLFRRAFELEREAAELVKEDLSAEPTRSILYRSAATLAIDCGELHEAMQLVAIGLAGNPPKEIAKELRELRRRIQSDQVVSVQLRPAQLLADGKQGLLAILRQGTTAWNAWREEYQNVADFPIINLIRVDLQTVELSAANLQRVNLQGADLWRANLRRANFREANLVGANLREADLRRAELYRANLGKANLNKTQLGKAELDGADLSGANLQGANLQGASLSEANLQGANLQEANLGGAILNDAILTDADMMDATIGRTSFGNVDLRAVHGLEAVRHNGPSTMGIDTLYNSQGHIPEVFLRGCGVPDSMITYARSLVADEQPIDYYSCFISYSSKDDAIAERLYADLQAKGVRCWLAPHDLMPGEVIVRGIDEAIRLHDKVILLLSEASVTSPWVAYEVNVASVREAQEGRTVLYPLRLDDTVLTTPQEWAVILRETRHIGDFRGWKDHNVYQAAFARFLRDLKAEQQ